METEPKLTDIINEFIHNNYCILEVIVNTSSKVIVIIVPKESEYKRIHDVLNNHYYKDNYILRVYKHSKTNDVITKEELVFNYNTVNNNMKLFNGSSEFIEIN